MFKSPPLFFIYFTWFVGILLIIYGVFNLGLGSVYLAFPQARETVFLNPLTSFFFNFFGGPFSDFLFIEDPMVKEDMIYSFMPPTFQTYLDNPEKLEKLSPEEKREFEKVYKKAEKKMERAFEESKKQRESFLLGLSILTFCKGFLGLILGIPLALITWSIGKRERETGAQGDESSV